MTTKGTDLFEYNGVEMQVKDIPDAETRHMLGYGHHNPYNRQVVFDAGVKYPFTPDTCEVADDNNAVAWIKDQTVLICNGCGLDCT